MICIDMCDMCVCVLLMRNDFCMFGMRWCVQCPFAKVLEAGRWCGGAVQATMGRNSNASISGGHSCEAGNWWRPMETNNDRIVRVVSKEMDGRLMFCSCIVSWLVCNCVPRHCLVCLIVYGYRRCLWYVLPLSENHPTTLSADQNGRGFSAVRASAASFWSWPRFVYGATMCNESNPCTTSTSATMSFKWHSRLLDFWKLQVDWNVMCLDWKASTKFVGTWC